MWPHNCWITSRKGGKCLQAEQNALALVGGSQTFSGTVKSQGCSSSQWEVPIGQTEMLWFSFKTLLQIGNWRKGVSTWSHATMAFYCLEFPTAVQRLNVVMSVHQWARTVSSGRKGCSYSSLMVLKSEFFLACNVFAESSILLFRLILKASMGVFSWAVLCGEHARPAQSLTNESFFCCCWIELLD